MATRVLSNKETHNHETLSKSLQVSTATLSFLSSSLIAFMTARKRNRGLSSPYRRIIFGLSFSDMIQSGSLIVSPWMIPSWVEGSWGHGNEASCRIFGFLLMVGSCSVGMYTVLLCCYYFCKLKKRMADATFFYKVERKAHFVIVLLNIILASISLGLGVIHTNPVTRSTCYVANTPLDCVAMPDVVGPCDPVIQGRVEIFLVLTAVAYPALCFCFIAYFMCSIYWHAHEMSKNPSTTSSQLQQLSRLYRRENLIQSSCYVIAFFTIYFPIIIIYFMVFMNVPVIPPFLQITGWILFPSGGLVNILIYTRPHVVSLRRNHPNCSRIKALLLVLKAGGEVPDEIDLSRTFDLCCHSKQREEDEGEDDIFVNENRREVENVESTEEQNEAGDIESVIDRQNASLPSGFDSRRTPSFDVSLTMSSKDICSVNDDPEVDSSNGGYYQQTYWPVSDPNTTGYLDKIWQRNGHPNEANLRGTSPVNINSDMNDESSSASAQGPSGAISTSCNTDLGQLSIINEDSEGLL